MKRGNVRSESFAAQQILDVHGSVGGLVSWDGHELHVENTGAAVANPDGARPYFVPALPVEVHCHGIGDVDFSDFAALDLAALDETSAAEGVLCIPTLYLRHDRLGEFVAFMRRYAQMRAAGSLPYVPGIALEGPLLASHGGTPAATVWPPTRAEWEILASCGPLGLVYVVMSPDALTPGSELHDRVDRRHPDLPWIVRTLVGAGIRPALGHFTRSDPLGSARLVEELVEVAWDTDSPITGARVVTDHLFNDMPLTIRHAFRTRRARQERDATLRAYDLPGWTLDDLPEQVGPVPAAIMRLCRQGKVASCINFDGEHVDLAIAARAVELVGRDNIMLMTDRCDSARLGGQALHRGEENGLWYQHGGIVAAGSQPMDRQLGNARSRGLDETAIWNLAAFAAYRAFDLGRRPELDAGRSGCFVEPSGDPGALGGLRRTAIVGAAPERAG
ncbi:hypothetical protein KIH74_14040 [Kineosporia sp. J2-2]|uniref:N-acetylglucosamine-6-phosphate deacetylase n=1 Tax=Kineosporia corallincola TaxID=2835133 RepID=A0ABS5TG36_9ACTN|nr:hypothetical protein [Kineosporia corallincola]MBT0770055.1 hypothetical protein [Kineosporia corallincola]